MNNNQMLIEIYRVSRKIASDNEQPAQHRTQNLCEPNKYKFVCHGRAHFTFWWRNFEITDKWFSIEDKLKL